MQSRRRKNFFVPPKSAFWYVSTQHKLTMSFLDLLKFDSNGLIPAIIQEQSTGRVLMMAWMNRTSLEKTIATGKTHFWSRSRQKLWMKGETSGHVQHVKQIAFDCDGDTLLIQVEQVGPACHEGYKSCFFRTVDPDGVNFTVTEPQLVRGGSGSGTGTL
ncbi:MAG: phosphoribosyl-AMP cyclohydrolase [Verrucomicrobiae bacterium]|nr:phosphoribosyl-AMP cyclohydrolase [Verrucomicrobiae bacterium]MCX7722196.1 phosphoribosyl-AMP cyclohydrolase [Verrucomicrobiae bacterium]